MNRKDLYQSFSAVDDEILERSEAAKKANKQAAWIKWGAVAACLGAVLLGVLTIPKLRTDPEALRAETAPVLEEAADGNSQDPVPDSKEDPIWETESVGGLKIGMTEQEILEILGQPDSVSNCGPMDYPDGSRRICWFYRKDSPDLHLTLADLGEGWFLNEILTFDECRLTLSSGIGTDSAAEEVEAAYPDAAVRQETNDTGGVPAVNVIYTLSGLQITVRNGTVHYIHLGPMLPEPAMEDWEAMEAEPSAYELTSEEITVYGPGDRSVTLVKKAAKRICTVLTIMEPEAAEQPEDAPQYWLDFGNGTVMAVYGRNDLGTVYTCSSFSPQDPNELELCLTGTFYGLDEALEAALQNPTEDWT